MKRHPSCYSSCSTRQRQPSLRMTPPSSAVSREARRSVYGGFRACNLFAFRATDPKTLKRAKQPIGPDNLAFLMVSARWADTILCAWGTHGAHMGMGRCRKNAASCRRAQPLSSWAFQKWLSKASPVSGLQEQTHSLAHCLATRCSLRITRHTLLPDGIEFDTIRNWVNTVSHLWQPVFIDNSLKLVKKSVQSNQPSFACRPDRPKLRLSHNLKASPVGPLVTAIFFTGR